MSELAPTPEQGRSSHRRAWWVLAALLALAALVLTPPLLNVNRLRRRFASSMSESLGRPVHMDKVTLNVLPMPGFTLENLVVSEDTAFGQEPVIRANTVRATLRASSLWRRQVEFAAIRFEEPSVNLVRRADGRWNLESILLHAAQKDAAPTAQTRPGTAPRFPYIEATGARVNVKLGNEKLPFALTEADFALWLPSPQQWRVRIEGKPARTDTSVSDTGLLRVEATLERAAHIAEVPIDMTVDWRRAPLGEASRIFTGKDAEWRGSVQATAVAHGTLGDAMVRGTLLLTDVRRADFIPARLMSVSMECSGRLAITAAVFQEPACNLPAGDARDRNAYGGVQSGAIVVTADTLDLTGLHTTGLRAGITNAPDAWLLDWARLFSQRIPSGLAPSGSVSGSIARTPAQDEGPGWQGEFHGSLELPGNEAKTKSGEDVRPAERQFSIAPMAEGFVLAPVNIAPSDRAPALLLSGTASRQSYTMQLSGAATADELSSLRALVPPLGDGLEAALPGISWIGVHGTTPVKIDVACTRSWGAAQSCIAAHPADAVKKPRTPHER